MKPITRYYFDLLCRWAPYFRLEVEAAARDGREEIDLVLGELPSQPEVVYACLWFADNHDVVVCLVPSSRIRRP
jgi:hypothetical protein